MPKSFSSIGLIGLGAFGKLIHHHLSPYFAITAYDPSPEAKAYAKRQNLTLSGLDETASLPIVILATPVHTLKSVCRDIAPHLPTRGLVIDVASVKVKPAQWLKDTLPPHVEILCTHPLFGPQSTKRGLYDHEIVICPIRVRRLGPIIRFLETELHLKVSVTSPEAHDKALAAVQGLTHLIAKVLSGLGELPSEHTTRSYDLMMQGLQMVSGDSDDLFLAIERDNPYASDLRKRFFAQIEGLKSELDQKDQD
jgi:prephenate dehydrogenase